MTEQVDTCTPITASAFTAHRFAKRIAARFDLVCFDLDQCAAQHHSRGRLLRKDLDVFSSAASADFVAAIPALLKENVRLAIVTHSDLAQHGPLRPRGVVVLGDDLVHEFLRRSVPKHAHEFFVVAWRPKSRGNEGKRDSGKIRHMRTCAAFYDVPIERCVLFDDDPTNCSSTIIKGKGSFAAYKSNPDVGFRFTDYLEETMEESSLSSPDNYFATRNDGSVDRIGRWEAKWNTEYQSRPRFHLAVANPNLVKAYGKEFHPPHDLPILLPLCGKTVDLKWLSDAGHVVVGVEGVRRGIEELRDEMLNKMRVLVCDDGSHTSIWTTAVEGQNWMNTSTPTTCISVVCQDFFQVSPNTFGQNDAKPCFGAVYDRGALVAVPPASRPEYVDVIDRLLVPGGQILLVTVDTGRGGGPPFPIRTGVVDELFSSRGYRSELLDEHDGDFGEGSKEYVFLLTKSLDV